MGACTSRVAGDGEQVSQCPSQQPADGQHADDAQATRTAQQPHINGAAAEQIASRVSDAEQPIECDSEQPAASERSCQDISNTEMVEDTLRQALELPHNFFEAGAYKSPCEDDRVAYSRAIGLLDSPLPDPQVDKILASLARVFDLPNVVLTLLGPRKLFLRNALGEYNTGDFPWRWGFCSWTLAPPNPQVVVVGDTLKDARFCDNKFVQGGPLVRFFAGAPLVASNGHRLGTVSILGPQPRTLTAGEGMILANMAELIVRELEKDTVNSTVAAKRAAGDALDKYMLRSVACFSNQAVAFIDTRPQLWQALHCNLALSNVTGITYDAATTQPFLDLFEPPFEQGSEAWTAMQEVVARAGEFVVRGCIVSDDPDLGAFTLTFRPADKGAFDEDTQLIGVPSDIPAPLDAVGRYYFVLCSPSDHDPEQQSAAAAGSDPLALAGLRQSATQEQTPIAGLELGTLLGKGSFGRVYRGKYNGRQVAVKVCSKALSQARGKRNKPWAGVEAVASKQLDHPCVVRTFKHTAVLLQEGKLLARKRSLEGEGGSRSSGSGGSWENGTGWYDDDQAAWADSDWGSAHPGALPPAAMVEMELWSCMEYCNRGTLQAGVDRGFFRQQCTGRTPGNANMPVVLATAAQLASGMSYLHSKGITHGDLCGGNVLLTSDDSQPHGFSVKVADFGLSRDLQFQTKTMQTASYGTVTHMPPELLLEGKLSKACDVYAFGILLWEMVNGARAWANMSHTQILAAVGMDGRCLAWPSSSHPGLRDLANACMQRNPKQRPTFPDIEEQLKQLQAEAGLPPSPTLVA